MLRFVRNELPLLGLVMLCATGAAQANACTSGNKDTCPLEVSSPSMEFPLYCSNGSPTVALASPVTYTITNYAPAPEGFEYSLVSNGSRGVVSITSSNCPGTVNGLSGSGLLPANGSCTVTLSVATDPSCSVGALDWELSVMPKNPRQRAIKKLIDPIQQAALTSPTIPTVPACVASSTLTGSIPAVVAAGTGPLCIAGNFTVLGGAALNNTVAAISSATRIIGGNASASRFAIAPLVAGSNSNLAQVPNVPTAGTGLGATPTLATATTADNLASVATVAAINAFITQGLNTCINPTQGKIFPMGTKLGDGPDADVAILSPGTYCLGETELIGKLRLSGAGNYFFNISGNLKVKNNGSDQGGLVLMNGASASNVYWVVGSTIGSDVTFDPAPSSLTPLQMIMGTVMARGNITVGLGVDMLARLLSTQGTITLNENEITRPL